MARRPENSNAVSSQAHPGTSDESVPKERLEGRIAFRSGLPDSDCPYPSGTSLGGKRTSWMLGYYDVRLKRFFTEHDRSLDITLPPNRSKENP